MDLKGSVYWQAFKDVWNFFKDSMPPPDVSDAERWDAIIGTAGQIMSEYRKTEIGSFATSLFLAAIDELDRLCKCKECQAEVKGGEQHGTSAEASRFAVVLEAGGASEGGREDKEIYIEND